VQIETRAETETEAAGERLAPLLKPGDVVLLYGELGAGKTALVRGLARGLSADPEDVSSPTFTIIQEYHGRVTLYHVDLYRLDSSETEDVSLEDLVCGDGSDAIEWADRWKGRPEGEEVVETRIEGFDDDRRQITTNP